MRGLPKWGATCTICKIEEQIKAQRELKEIQKLIDSGIKFHSAAKLRTRHRVLLILISLRLGVLWDRLFAAVGVAMLLSTALSYVSLS